MKTWTTWRVVHVFIRGPASSRAALHQAELAYRLDLSPFGLSDEERAQDLALRVRAAPRLVRRLRAPAEVLAGAERTGCKHFLEQGRCIAPTIKSLGYPSRSLLSAWLQELHPQECARVVGRSQELAPAAKQAAVIALCTRPVSAQTVAEDLGVSRGSLYKWKNQLLGHDASTPTKRQQDAPANPDRAELEQQLEPLRRDIRRLQFEKDLLKKANELPKKRRNGHRPAAPDESGEDAAG